MGKYRNTKQDSFLLGIILVSTTLMVLGIWKLIELGIMMCQWLSK